MNSIDEFSVTLRPSEAVHLIWYWQRQYLALEGLKALTQFSRQLLAAELLLNSARHSSLVTSLATAAGGGGSRTNMANMARTVLNDRILKLLQLWRFANLQGNCSRPAPLVDD
ncbi:MAG: hypothetical protein OXH37_06495 [Gammaproteobacteria bacterium]|nr:hypothetical protein [Gammaproteobacteria bacterium]